MVERKRSNRSDQQYAVWKVADMAKQPWTSQENIGDKSLLNDTFDEISNASVQIFIAD
jgi:hypothetical protein